MLTPDAGYAALAEIWYDIFGHQGCFRPQPITDSEWREIEERVHTLRVMNQPKEKVDGNGTGSNQTA